VQAVIILAANLYVNKKVRSVTRVVPVVIGSLVKFQISDIRNEESINHTPTKRNGLFELAKKELATAANDDATPQEVAATAQLLA